MTLIKSDAGRGGAGTGQIKIDNSDVVQQQISINSFSLFTVRSHQAIEERGNYKA